MKSTTFKRCLNLTLAISMSLSAVAPASLAQAQTGDVNDPIALLIASMKADSPSRAKELLEQAKAQLQKEQLPDQSMRKVEALLYTAEQSIEKRGPQRPKSDRFSQDSAPIGFTFDDKGQVVPNKPVTTTAPTQTPTPTPTPAPVASSETDELQKLLLENPALRDSMREIGKGRVTRDANQLQSTMPGQIAEQTRKDVALATAQDSSNAWLQTLRATGLIIKNAGELNANLRDHYEGVPTEFLADLIIKDAAWFSGGAGAARHIATKLKDIPGVAKAGIIGEAGATFIINTNMVLRLIDLYGLKLSAANEEVVIMSIFASFKAGAQLGIKSKAFQETAGKTGSLFMKAALTRSKDAMKKYVSVVLNHPFMLKVLRRAPIALGQPGNLAAAAVVPANPATPGTPQTPDVVPGADGVLPAKKLTLGALTMEGISFVLHVGLSAMETYGVGQAAKAFIKNALQSEREASNESIRQLLLSTKGDGFLKLLILSMNVGNHIPSFTKPETADNAKVRFILNLARATKRCSPADRVAFQKAAAAQKQTLVTKVKGAATSAPLGERILRYACDNNMNQDNYKQLIQEFSTLNSIPQNLVTSLRLEKYGRRVRLGEIVYQMMFLDGGIDNEELAFFNDTVAKILGLEILEGMRYFDKFHAFIVDHNGMVKSAASPTGYAIGAEASENPYDLSIGFTTPGGPNLTLQQAQTQ